MAYRAATKARGTASMIAKSVASPVSMSVTGRRSAMSAVTGTRKASECAELAAQDALQKGDELG